MPETKSGTSPWRIAGLVAPQLLLVAVGAWWVSSNQNSLKNNGRWVSTKAGLARNVMGAQAFFGSYETLAGEELDLGRWFGCQELLYEEALPLEEVCFDFLPAENAYLSFVFGGSEAGFHGLRLSTNPLYDDCVFTATPEGEFRSKSALNLGQAGGPVPGDWSRLCVSFDADGFAAELDGRPLGRFEAQIPERQRFGFRNGAESVRIDEIEMRIEGRERALVESFVNWHNRRRNFGLGLIGVLLLDAILLALLRRRAASFPKWTARAAALSLGLLIGGGIFFAVWRTQLSKLYQGADDAVEFDWRREGARKISKDLNEWCAGEVEPGRTRVLVLGGSQTWGSGASDKQHTFVRTLERLLNEERPGGREDRYQFINGGVSGLIASWLFELYRDDWIGFAPALVILNVSSNDNDNDDDTEAEDFVGALESFVALNRERGIQTLFSLEPNSIEKHPLGLPLHSEMRALAQRLDVPLVDTHAYLVEGYDSGILWWDFVHPTSYGHHLIAEALAPAVKAICESAE